MILKRPMLAAPTKQEDLLALPWPMLGSAKLDGVRGITIRGGNGLPVLVSRKLEIIPNAYCQHLFAREEFIGLDGELIVGCPTDKGVYTRTTSGVMSEHGCPQVTWHVFDRWNSEQGYAQRATTAKLSVEAYQQSTMLDTVQWLKQTPLYGPNELATYEDQMLAAGYEGVILRHPRSPYKQNRSTLKQAWMVKVKRFEDAEAEIIDTVELMRNENEATIDATGFTKRSHAQGGKVAGGMLGTLVVRGINGRWKGVEFEIGTGFTEEQRINLWKGRHLIVGKLVKYKHFPIGAKDKPRHPVFLGFRDKRD